MTWAIRWAWGAGGVPNEHGQALHKALFPFANPSTRVIQSRDPGAEPFSEAPRLQLSMFRAAVGEGAKGLFYLFYLYIFFILSLLFL